MEDAYPLDAEWRRAGTTLNHRVAEYDAERSTVTPDRLREETR